MIVNLLKIFLNHGKLYAPFNKGGIFRKWYGNFEYVIKFNKENYFKLLNQGNHLPSRNCYFKKGITWSLFGFENFGVRFKDYGYVFDVSGSSMFPEDKDVYYIIGYLCSNVCFKFLSCLAPTVNFQVGNIGSIPFKIETNIEIRKKIDKLVKDNIKICQEEWSFYETSLDFKAIPFIMPKFKEKKFEESLKKFEKYYNNLRNKLRENEEELNKIFIDIFELQNEIDFAVNDRDLTIKPFNKTDFVKNFLSYSVGCSVGRYDFKRYSTNYNECNYKINLDDLDKSFENLLIEIFGKETFEENLNYIKNILNIKSIKNYYKKEFMVNHRKQYQNRQIYFEN